MLIGQELAEGRKKLEDAVKIIRQKQLGAFNIK